MLNPLKISEMLSQANQMQEEVQQKACPDCGGRNQRRRRSNRNDEWQEAASQNSH